MIKVIRTGLKCEEADYKFKLDHAIRFLGNNEQVNLILMFKAREVIQKELGKKLLLKFADDLENYAKVELPPIMDGKQMSLMFTPKAVK